MASPADKRLLELLDKWLTSLELHRQYSSLDDDSYWKVQPWIEHQRPNRWILDLAKQKAIALKTQVEARIASNDAQFSDSLELMIFLANLVGAEHIERFIPMAEAQNVPVSDVTGTREMPKFLVVKQPTASAGGNSQVARVERKGSGGAKAPAKGAGKSSKAAADMKAGHSASADGGVPQGGPAHAAREQVVADAVRLVQWGRKWFELPELIARMAGRPPLADVRRLLKENKPAIDEKAKN